MTVLRNIKVVDEDLVDALQSLPRGSVPGDCILYKYWIVIVRTGTAVKHVILFRVTVCVLSVYYSSILFHMFHSIIFYIKCMLVHTAKSVGGN